MNINVREGLARVLPYARLIREGLPRVPTQESSWAWLEIQT